MTVFLRRFWQAAACVTPRPVGVVVASRMLDADSHDVDVCIVTNCAFVGGNASTTVTEFLTLSQAGLRVLIVHCPLKRSPWKRAWIAERFRAHQDHIVDADLVKRVRCNALIVRGPRLAMMRSFRRLASRMETKRALFIVNDSAWNERGKADFDWPTLHRRVAELGLPRSAIYPIGPLVRAESDRALAGSGVPDQTAPIDWPPLFDTSQFEFAPREQLTFPVVIGRHGRDHPGKWPEDPNEIKAAYPLRDDVRIDILGGADTVAERLGGLPANWSVKGFGAFAVSQYLHTLDVFVYFPARTRTEAFGRTVIEAVLSGVPVILPRQLSPTFGEIALYGEPASVYDLIGRLAADNQGRKKYLHDCQQIAIDRYGSHTLVRRLTGGDHARPPALVLSEESKAFRDRIMGST